MVRAGPSSSILCAATVHEPHLQGLTPIQDTLFGRSLTPAERLRQHQRSLVKAQRELDREKSKLEAQEKKTMADIKKNAKAGNMVSKPELESSLHCQRSRVSGDSETRHTE